VEAWEAAEHPTLYKAPHSQEWHGVKGQEKRSEHPGLPGLSSLSLGTRSWNLGHGIASVRLRLRNHTVAFFSKSVSQAFWMGGGPR
jgi:hypothetical protein